MTIGPGIPHLDYRFSPTKAGDFIQSSNSPPKDKIFHIVIKTGDGGSIDLNLDLTNTTAKTEPHVKDRFVKWAEKKFDSQYKIELATKQVRRAASGLLPPAAAAAAATAEPSAGPPPPAALQTSVPMEKQGAPPPAAAPARPEPSAGPPPPAASIPPSSEATQKQGKTLEELYGKWEGDEYDPLAR